MSRVCDHDELEALAAGELSTEVSGEVATHAAGCAQCGEELRWLRAEREVMRRRAAHAPLPPNELADLWSGVEARLATRPRPRAWWRPASFASTVAAAAVLAFFVGRNLADRAHRADDSRPVIALGDSARGRVVSVSARSGGERDPRLVLDAAESQWQAAAGELERRYSSRRGRLSASEAARFDQNFSRTRREIAEARAQAGGDVEARAQALDGYVGYVSSLQLVVSELEVAP
jgi:hypothetical protein